MCLDIDPSSVIHKHIDQKILDLDRWHEQTANPITGEEELGYHNLTMLPSFHISLGAPKKEIKVDAINNKFCHMGIVPIVGDITLAPICISEKDNKKSAWIPLHPCWLDQILLTNELNLDQFDSFDHRCDECPVQHLHVSVANLTGNPHDSIARPEDCIIDTIRA